jgi:hypothetical protein
LAEAQKAGCPIDTFALKRKASYTAENWALSLAFEEEKLLKTQLRER